MKVWQNHGLQQAPKIQLTETKQIVPDKNLFGQSNFAENAFNVIIQLGMKAAPGRNHLKKPSHENENRTKKHLDIVGNQDKMDIMVKRGETNNDNEDSYTDDSANNADHVTSGDNIAASESVVTSADDKIGICYRKRCIWIESEKKK